MSEKAQIDAEAAALELTERVVEEMQRTGLKRIDLAKRLGITKSAVTQFLDGENFTFLTAAMLARAVGLRFTIRAVPHGPEERERILAFVRYHLGKDAEHLIRTQPSPEEKP